MPENQKSLREKLEELGNKSIPADEDACREYEQEIAELKADKQWLEKEKSDLEAKISSYKEERFEKLIQFYKKPAKYLAVAGIVGGISYLGISNAEGIEQFIKLYCSDTLKGAAAGAVMFFSFSTYDLLKQMDEFGQEPSLKKETLPYILFSSLAGAVGGAISYNLIPNFAHHLPHSHKPEFDEIINLIGKSSGAAIVGGIVSAIFRPDLEKKFEENLTTSQKADHFFKKGLNSWFSWRKERFYRKCLKYNSRNSAAWNNLGILLSDDEEILCFQKALEISPDDAMYNSNLGNAYYRRYQFGSALVHLEKAGSMSSEKVRELQNKMPGVGSDVGKSGARFIAETYSNDKYNKEGLLSICWECDSVTEFGNKYSVKLEGKPTASNYRINSPSIAKVNISKEGDLIDFVKVKNGRFEQIVKKN